MFWAGDWTELGSLVSCCPGMIRTQSTTLKATTRSEVDGGPGASVRFSRSTVSQRDITCVCQFPGL